MVAARLAGIEDVDVEMRSNSASGNGSIDVGTIDDLSAKFSVQGTSHTKSSGKKKVVSTITKLPFLKVNHCSYSLVIRRVIRFRR